MDVEYTPDNVTEAVNRAAANYDEARSELVAIEKYARNNEKAPLLKSTVEGLLTIAWNSRDTARVIDTFHFILTRRAQQKAAITAAVHMCMGYINTLKDEKDFKGYEELTKSVCQETEGKVFVDLERARIVKDYALFLESSNHLTEATELMQTMHIETFTSLDKKERIDFLIIQLRILLKCKDYVRSLIIANKVNLTTIQGEGFELQRIQYCKLMIDYNIHQKDYLDCCRKLLMIYNTLTEMKPEQAAELKEEPFIGEFQYCHNIEVTLKLAVMFILAAEFIPEKKDMLTIIHDNRQLEEYPKYQEAVRLFLTEEIINCATILPLYTGLFKEDCCRYIEINQEDINTHLELQIIQHNIRVVAKYYHTITLERFAELLSITTDILEKQICKAVNEHQIYAKIDRPKKVVTFVKPKDPKEVLQTWSSDIDVLLSIVNDTCFLIETEEMVHARSEQK